MSVSGIRMGRAFVEIGADTAPLSAALNRAKAMMQGWGQQLMGVGSAMLGTGLAMAGAISPAITQFADYEQALADLRAASNPTAESFATIKAKIEEISKATGIAPTEVTRAFSELLKTGKSAEQVIGGLGESVIQFARVSGVEMAQAAVVLSDLTNVFGISATEASDIISRAEGASTANLQQMVDAFANGGNAAHLFGQNMQDTATALAILHDAMIKGPEAGTALRTVLRRLGTGTESAGAAMAEIGLNVRDASGEMLPMIDILRRLDAALVGKSPEERQRLLSDIGGAYGMSALSALLESVGGGWARMEGEMAKSLTVGERFAIMQGTLWTEMKKLWVNLQFTAIALGEALAPAMRGFMPLVNLFLTGLTNWITQNQTVIQTFGVLIAQAVAFGAAILGIGTLVYGAGTAFGVLAFVLAAATRGFGLLSAAGIAWSMVTTIASTIASVAMAGFSFVLGLITSGFGLAKVFALAYSGVLMLVTGVQALMALGAWGIAAAMGVAKIATWLFNASAIGAAISTALATGGLNLLVGSLMLLALVAIPLTVAAFAALFGAPLVLLAVLFSRLSGLTDVFRNSATEISSAWDQTTAGFMEAFGRIVETGLQAWATIKDAFAAGRWDLIWQAVDFSARLMWNDLSYFLTSTFLTWKDLISDTFDLAWFSVKTGFFSVWGQIEKMVFGSLADIVQNMLRIGGPLASMIDPLLAKDLRSRAAGAKEEGRARTRQEREALEERQRLNRIARFERDMRRDLDSLATEEGLQLGLDFTQFDASTADLMQHLSPEDREMAQHLREIRDINREIGELGFARDHQAELEDFLAQAEERAALPLMFGTTDGLASRLPSLGAVAQTSNFGAFGSFSGSAISGFGMASPADRTANAVERIENLTQEQLDRATDANELLERILREGGGLVAF